MTTDTPVPLGLDIESTHSGDPKQTKQIVEPASMRRQVGRSVLTLADEGYLLRSIDTPDRTLLVRFNGSVLAKDDGTYTPSEALTRDSSESASADTKRSIEVHGVAGIFGLELFRYLLVITSSRDRGSIDGSNIYEATKVAALPLDYDSGAKHIDRILQAANKEQLKQHERTASDTGTPASGIMPPEEAPDPSSLNSANPDRKQSTSWMSPQLSKLLGMSKKKVEEIDLSEDTDGSPTHEQQQPPPPPQHSESHTPAEEAAGDGKAGSSAHRMESRIVEEIRRVFGVSGMFYSYGYDLTRSLEAKNGQAAVAEDTVLADIVDGDYWFNHHLQKLLLKDSAAAWALPLVQGCVQIAMCSVADGDSFQVSVVSRRSCRRVGVRYERRGANADGYVANFVETEQILSFESGDGKQFASFVQTRGSMPFFWKQPAAGLHPVPVVLRNDASNAHVCALHLEKEIERLGRQVIVNLVEQRGREDIVGSKYAALVGECVANEMVDAQAIRYIPWDFHHETRGMRFENLNQLLEQLQGEIARMGYFWQADKQLLIKQSGAFRVNCMDCLDRTNVVQSAIARYVLNEQLVRLGIHVAPELGLSAYSGLEATMNNLWANNGDYISRQYAGTSAMKGDFTRTGKRNLAGVMSDASYSLARLWINTFRDYFSQSALDFIMGSQTSVDVFRTLVDLKSREPDHALQLGRAREAAIEASIAIVVHDGEYVQLALVVRSPMQLGVSVIRHESDAVMVLTDVAVYVCGYHYQMERVEEFVRVELKDITAVQHGAYITDTAMPQALDVARNNGIVLYFAKGVAQFNSGTVQDASDTRNASRERDSDLKSVDMSSSASSIASTVDGQPKAAKPPTDRPAAGDEPGEIFLACKLADEAQVVMQLVPGQPSTAVGASASSNQLSALSLARLKSLEDQSPEMLAECLCSMIQSAKTNADVQSYSGGQFVLDAPIISPAEAKRKVSVMSKVTKKIHHAFWI